MPKRWNAMLNAQTALANGGHVTIYDSTGTGQPATPDVAITSQVLLATVTLGSPAFGAASAGIATANAITSGTAVATGTAAWWRAFKSDGTTAELDGSVGTSAADMIIATTSIVSGATVSVSSLTVGMPTAQ